LSHREAINKLSNRVVLVGNEDIVVMVIDCW